MTAELLNASYDLLIKAQLVLLKENRLFFKAANIRTKLWSFLITVCLYNAIFSHLVHLKFRSKVQTNKLTSVANECTSFFGWAAFDMLQVLSKNIFSFICCLFL